MDSGQGKRRRIDHKRSKQGCLTCRTRRKKCAEDFQRWPDGSWACSACNLRGQICRLPSRTAAAALRRPSHPPSPLSAALVPTPSPPLMPAVEEAAPSRTQRDDIASIPLPSLPPVVGPPPPSTTTTTGAAMNPSMDIFGRNSWLDSFFDEFMELTGPTMQQCHGNSSGGGGGSSSSTRTHAFDAATMTTTGASPSQSSDARPSPQSQTSVRPWSDSVIDRTVRSDDLDELLVRWSPIYETYLCAIFDTSKPAGDAPLMDRLMDVTRTDNTCKASMVACCLAYRDVIERELQCARPPSRFVRYMLHGSGSDGGGGGKGVGGGSRARTKGGDSCQRCSCHSSWTEERPTHLASSASHFAHAWLRFAHDGFERTKAGMPIATKLLTLLNIRYASVCLLGARDSFALAPDIHAALTEVEVDIDYLYDTYKCGTTLSFMVQALAFANAMDAATIRGARSAIRDHAPASGSTVLSRDSAVNPLADYCYVTMLSVGLLECIKRISDLAADIDEGRVLLKADVDARSERIQDLIMTSDIDLPRDMCDVAARVRAFSLHEMWRQAVLLQLYQDVHRLGPVASKVQLALSQIIRLSELLPATERDDQAPQIDVWDMSMVWFLACTVAITEEQRAVCLSQLESLGSERAVLDNVHAVKVIWRVMDETGRAVDWREVLVEHGLTICYTF